MSGVEGVAEGGRSCGLYEACAGRRPARSEGRPRIYGTGTMHAPQSRALGVLSGFPQALQGGPYRDVR